MHQLYSRARCILYIQNSPSQNANFVSFPLYPNIFELASRENLEINDDVEEGTSDDAFRRASISEIEWHINIMFIFPRDVSVYGVTQIHT